MSEQKGGMPARLALEVAHQMGKLLQGEVAMVPWEKALEYLREARMAGLPASIDYQPSPPSPSPGRYVLVLDSIVIVIERAPVPQEVRKDEVEWFADKYGGKPWPKDMGY